MKLGSCLTDAQRADKLNSFLVEVRRPPVAGPKLPGSFGRPGEKGFQGVRSAETVAIAESRRLGDTPKGLSTVIRCKTGGALSRSEDTSRASRVSFLLVSFHSRVSKAGTDECVRADSSAGGYRVNH